MKKKNDIILDEENNRAFIVIVNKKGVEKRAVIDIEDVEKVKDYKWKINTSGIVSCILEYSPERKEISLSRFVLGLESDFENRQMVYYRNGNKLNCRKYNLYIREQRYKRLVGKNTKLCGIDGCDNKVVARGLCRMHYGRLIRRNKINSDLNE